MSAILKKAAPAATTPAATLAPAPAVIPTQTTEVSTELFDPSLLGMSDGTENLPADSRTFPFLKIAQDKTPQAVKPTATQPNPSFVDGLEFGMLFNSNSNKVYGTGVRVIPVFCYDMYTIWGKNLGDFVGNMLPSEFDAEVEANKWQVNEKRQFIQGSGEALHRAVFTRNFFCLLPDDTSAGLVLLSMASVGLTQARKWLSNMDRIFLPSPPYPTGTAAKKFLQIWKLGTVLDIRPAGNSYQLGTKAKSCIEFDSIIDKSMVPWVTQALAQVQAIGNFKTVAVDAETAHATTSEGPDPTDIPAEEGGF